MSEEILEETKVICNFDRCIFNQYKKCRRSEITLIEYNGYNAICTDYGVL